MKLVNRFGLLLALLAASGNALSSDSSTNNDVDSNSSAAKPGNYSAIYVISGDQKLDGTRIMKDAFTQAVAGKRTDDIVAIEDTLRLSSNGSISNIDGEVFIISSNLGLVYITADPPRDSERYGFSLARGSSATNSSMQLLKAKYHGVEVDFQLCSERNKDLSVLHAFKKKEKLPLKGCQVVQLALGQGKVIKPTQVSNRTSSTSYPSATDSSKSVGVSNTQTHKSWEQLGELLFASVLLVILNETFA